MGAPDEGNLQIKPLSGGLSDKLRPALINPGEWSEIKNITFQGKSARTRLGALPFTRTKPKGSALLLRDDEFQFSGFSQVGNTYWNSWVEIPSSVHINSASGFSSTAWTVEILVRLDVYPRELFGDDFDDGTIFCKHEVGATGREPLVFGVRNLGHASLRKMFIKHTDSAGNIDTYNSTDDFPLGVPAMVSIVRNGANILLYWDGVLKDTFALTAGANVTLDSSGSISIGRRKCSTPVGGTGVGANNLDNGLFGAWSELRGWTGARDLVTQILPNIRLQIEEADKANLFMYFPLNEEISSREIKDESGHRWNGFLCPSFPISTKFGEQEKDAYFFDGYSSVLNVSVSNNILTTQFAGNLNVANVQDGINFTMEIGWTPGRIPNYAGANDWDVVLDARNVVSIGINRSGQIQAGFYNGSAVINLLLTSASLVVPGQRYMISVRRTGPTCELYINGALEASGVNTNTLSNTLSHVNIGSFRDAATSARFQHALGIMDEFRLWGKHVTGTTIAANWNRKLIKRSNVGGNGVDGQFHTFEFPRICALNKAAPKRVTSSTFFGSIGFFFDNENSYAIFPSFSNADGTKAVQHIFNIISATEIELLTNWVGAEIGVNTGRSIMATKLLYWNDCKVDTLDPLQNPIFGRPLIDAPSTPAFTAVGIVIDADPREFGMDTRYQMIPNDTIVGVGIARPADLVPRWTEGFFSRPEAPITGLEYFKSNGGRDRFLLAMSGRDAYWATDHWSKESPFSRAVDPDARSILFLGRDRIQIPYGASKGIDFPSNSSFTSIEFWMNPNAVGKQGSTERIIYLCGKQQGAGSLITDIRVQLKHGRIEVLWTRDAGVGNVIIATLGSVIRKGIWQHVLVQFRKDTTSVLIYVNGNRQFTSISVSGAVDDAPTTEDFRIGFHKELSDRFPQGVFGYEGYLYNFRIADGQLYTAGGNGFHPPSAPLVDSSATRVLLLLEEGRDVFIRDSSSLHATATAKAHGQLIAEEWIRIEQRLLEEFLLFSDPEESPLRIGKHRERAYFTNGKSIPCRVIHNGDLRDSFVQESTPYGFEMTRWGIRAPTRAPFFVNQLAGPFFPIGSFFTVHYTYYNSKKGVESNPSPTLLNVFGVARDEVMIETWPSHDPQVDKIRIYISILNTGLTHLWAEIDAEERQTALNSASYSAALVAGGQPLQEDNGEAPRAKLLFFQEGFGFMANEPGFPTAFRASKDENVESFPPLSIKRLDSDSGDPLSALSGANGNVYGHQKTAIFSIRPGGNFESFSFSQIQADQGAIGGRCVTNINGRDFFRGDRGVIAFSGSDHQEVSHQIESTYRGRLDDLVNFPGLEFELVESSYAVNWMRGNEIWFTCRAKGAARNNRILVLNRSIENGPWSVYEGLEYSALIQGENLDGQRALYGGTYTGHVFVLESGLIDGEDKIPLTNDTVSQVTGIVGAGSTTSQINISGGEIIHSYGDGYAGKFLTVVIRNPVTIDDPEKITHIARVRIKSSTASAFILSEAIPFNPLTAGDPLASRVWIVGAIEWYFTSGWIDAGMLSASKYWSWFDCAFRPLSQKKFDFYWETTMDNDDPTLPGRVLADLFDRSIAKQKRNGMDQGYFEWQALDDSNRGRFFRFSLYGVDSESPIDAFEVGIRAIPETQGGGPDRS